jgi:predicted metalloprotease
VGGARGEESGVRGGGGGGGGGGESHLLIIVILCWMIGTDRTTHWCY